MHVSDASRPGGKEDMNHTRFQTLERARVLVVCIFLVVGFWYFQWRLSTLNPDAVGFSTALLAAELFGFMTAMLHVLMTWRLTLRESHAPRRASSVDVFITTINEPADLVRKTVLAAQNMAYRHTTWLLDDGTRPEMAQLAAELGINYLTRENRRHAKAGNLNNALSHSRSEFVAVFDADHAPRHDFLTRTLGYFDDPSVAFVQTPQDFYNLDSYQHRGDSERRAIWSEQSLFFRVLQRGKDYWNAAFFCGSCAVLRRSSLDAIGGFATGTVTEDLHTSIRLHKRGFKSVYHPEPLAFGLAPASLAPFLRQRTRWGQGAMQVWRREGVLFGRGLTLAQRLNYFASMITYIDGWQKAFFYAAPVIVLATGTMPLRASGMEFLLHFIPYYLLTFWAFEELGRGYGRTLLIEQYNMARFLAFAWGTLFFFKRDLRFRVTPKSKSQISPKGQFLLPQLLVLILNWAAIPLGVGLFMLLGHLPHDALIANIVWAGVNGLLALAVVRFTRRTEKYGRREYRFPLPLVANLSGRHSGVLLMVDDISSSGCRLYGSLDLDVGDEITGQISLPMSVLPFRARVTARIPGGTKDNSYAKALGCSFVWESAQHRDRLDVFLYGSDLQWALQQLADRVPTPLERLTCLQRPAAAVEIGRVKWWATMAYSLGGHSASTTSVGIISVPWRDNGKPLVILFQAPPSREISGRVVTRTGEQVVRLFLQDLQGLESPLGSIYLCQARVLDDKASTVAYVGRSAIKQAA